MSNFPNQIFMREGRDLSEAVEQSRSEHLQRFDDRGNLHYDVIK